MNPRVEVTAFESTYAPPGAALEQQEALGPGYGSCDGATRVVRGKLLRLLNPREHFSVVAPPGACGRGDATDPDSTSGELFFFFPFFLFLSFYFVFIQVTCTRGGVV